MPVTNNISEAVIAFFYHTSYGYGEDTRIEPGETKEVTGPYIGEMGNGACHLMLEENITCHEGPDDDKGYQVGKGLPLCLFSDPKGVTIRHHSEERDV